MGADQTPDPTAWDDDQLDSLLDRLAERAAERDDLDLPGSGASRRGVLAGLLGLGGAAAGASVASAIGENESYGSSSGDVGTDSEPLNEANVQDLHAQDAQIDNLLEAEQLSVAESGIVDFGSVPAGDAGSDGVAFSGSFTQPPLVLTTPGSTQTGEPTVDATSGARSVSTSSFTFVVSNFSQNSTNLNHCSYIVLVR